MLIEFWAYLAAFSVFFQKRMFLSSRFIAGEGIEMNGMHGMENAFFHIRVVFFQLPNQFFHFPAFGNHSRRFRLRHLLCQSASALHEMQIIVAGPGNNILLPYAVDGANQFHSRKILTVELGKHCLQLRTVKKSEKRRFDDIIIVMTKRNFIAAAVSGGAVKISPAHAGTEVAGRMIRMLRRCEDLPEK